MNELIKVNYDEQENPTVSARDLHEGLEIKTAFKDWFPRMAEYGFEDGKDFCSKMSESTGGRPAIDYDITLDMAKQICMIQRTEKGKQYRQYFLDLEKAWNTPELVMARGLQASKKLLEKKDEIIQKLTADTERMKPKEVFADAVTASDTSILIRDLAKLIKQNGVDIGQNRLFGWLRQKGYLCRNSNTPTQRAMEMGLFEIIERTIQRANEPPRVTSTTKVTGKGQIYFIQKFLGSKEA